MTPNYSVRDIRETVTFYRNILGFKLEMAVQAGSTLITFVGIFLVINFGGCVIS